MTLLVCRACGEFVRAFRDGGMLVPTPGECPDCGGTEFEDDDSGRTIRAG